MSTTETIAPVLARTTDLATSHEAAAKQTSELRARYYLAIRALLTIHPDGLTDSELTEQYELLAPVKGWPFAGLDPQNVRRRRSDLWRKYREVAPSPVRRDGRTVWALVSA